MLQPKLPEQVDDDGAGGAELSEEFQQLHANWRDEFASVTRELLRAQNTIAALVDRSWRLLDAIDGKVEVP